MESFHFLRQNNEITKHEAKKRDENENKQEAARTGSEGARRKKWEEDRNMNEEELGEEMKKKGKRKIMMAVTNIWEKMMITR